MFLLSTFRATYTNAATRPPSPLLPLAGWLTGLAGLGAYWLGTVLFPPPYLPVLLSMTAVAGLTLARPESGFALYAGTSAKQPGTVPPTAGNGTTWLVFLLLARFFAIQALFANETFGPTVALKYGMAHSLSHWLAASISWSKPTGQFPSVGARVLATLAGLLPMLVLMYLTTLWIYALFLVPLLLLRGVFIGRFRRDGGYTGAGLGAVQQLSELLIYLSFVSLLWVSI